MRKSNNKNMYNLIESDLLNIQKPNKSAKINYPTDMNNNLLANVFNRRNIENFQVVAESEKKKIVVAESEKKNILVAIPEVKSTVAVSEVKSAGAVSEVKTSGTVSEVKSKIVFPEAESKVKAEAASIAQTQSNAISEIKPEYRTQQTVSKAETVSSAQQVIVEKSYIRSEISPAVYFVKTEAAQELPFSKSENQPQVLFETPPSALVFKPLLTESNKQVTLINGGKWNDGSNILNNGGIYFDQDKEWTQVSGAVINLNQFENTEKNDLLSLLQNLLSQVGDDKCEGDVPCKKLILKFVGVYGYVVFTIINITKGTTSFPTIYTNTIPDADLVEFGGVPNEKDLYRVSYCLYDSRPKIIVEEEPPVVVEEKVKKYKSKDLIIPLPDINAKITLWLDGSDPLGDTSIPDDKTQLFNWIDKSKEKRNGETAPDYIGTDYIPPLVVTSDNPDNTVVRFDKDQNYLITYPSFPNTAYTIFTVQKSSQTADFSRLIHAPAASDSSLYIGIRGDNISSFTGDGNLWNDIDPNTATLSNVNTWRLLTVQVKGDDLYPYVDGTPQDNKIGTTAPFNDLLIGYFDSQSWIGDVAEILIFDSALDNADRKKIEVYLSTKWKINYNDVKEEPVRIPIEVLQEQKAAKQEALIATLSEIAPIVKIAPKPLPDVVVKIVDGVKVAVKKVDTAAKQTAGKQTAGKQTAGKQPAGKQPATKVLPESSVKQADAKPTLIARSQVNVLKPVAKSVTVPTAKTGYSLSKDDEQKFKDALLAKADAASKDVKTAAQTAAVARDATIVTSKKKKKKSKKKKKKSKKRSKKAKKVTPPVAKFENTEHFQGEEENLFTQITNKVFSKISEGFNLFFN